MTDIIDLDPPAAVGVSDTGLERLASLPTNKALTVAAKTKADLLDAAKTAVAQGQCSLRSAAEALGEARDRHNARQREMAEAVGMSVGWVNRLLKWLRLGYKDASPFGPTTKQGRVQHAERRNQKKADEVVKDDHQLAAPQEFASSSRVIDEIKLAIYKLDANGRAEILSYVSQIMKSAAL